MSGNRFSPVVLTPVARTTVGLARLSCVGTGVGTAGNSGYQQQSSDRNPTLRPEAALHLQATQEIQIEQLRWQNEALSRHLEEAQQQLVLQAAQSEGRIGELVEEVTQSKEAHAQMLLQLRAASTQKLERQAAVAKDRAKQAEQAKDQEMRAISAQAENAVMVAQLREASAVYQQTLQQEAMEEAHNREEHVTLNANTTMAQIQEQLVAQRAAEARFRQEVEDTARQQAAAAAAKQSMLESKLEEQAAMHKAALKGASDQALLTAQEAHTAELQAVRAQVAAEVAQKELMAAELAQERQRVVHIEALKASALEELDWARKLHAQQLTEAKREAAAAASTFAAKIAGLNEDGAERIRLLKEQADADALDARRVAAKALRDARDEAETQLARLRDTANTQLEASETKRAEVCTILVETKSLVQEISALLQEAMERIQELEQQAQEHRHETDHLRQHATELQRSKEAAAEQSRVDQALAIHQIELQHAHEIAQFRKLMTIEVMALSEAGEAVKQLEGAKRLQPEEAGNIPCALGSAEANATEVLLAEVQAMAGDDSNSGVGVDEGAYHSGVPSAQLQQAVSAATAQPSGPKSAEVMTGSNRGGDHQGQDRTNHNIRDTNLGRHHRDPTGELLQRKQMAYSTMYVANAGCATGDLLESPAARPRLAQDGQASVDTQTMQRMDANRGNEPGVEDQQVEQDAKDQLAALEAHNARIRQWIVAQASQAHGITTEEVHKLKAQNAGMVSQVRDCVSRLTGQSGKVDSQ